MKKYYWMVGSYFLLIFLAAEIYSFVYDIEVTDHVVREYLEYNSTADDPISFKEWTDRQDEKREQLLDWLADECDASLNFWYEPPSYEGD